MLQPSAHLPSTQEDELVTVVVGGVENVAAYSQDGPGLAFAGEQRHHDEQIGPVDEGDELEENAAH